MAGFLTPDTIIDRIVLLLRAYLNTEVDLIDTTNNAIGSGTVNDFATGTVASAAIQPHLDRMGGERIRVVVSDEGQKSNRQFTMWGLADGASEPDSTLPRLDRNTRVGITVAVVADGGADTTAGATGGDHARRECNRIAEAVVSLMHRYPRLSIPTSAIAVLQNCAGIDLASDTRAREVQQDSVSFYARKIEFDVRTIEGRA